MKARIPFLFAAAWWLSSALLSAQIDTAWVRNWDSQLWDEAHAVVTDDSNNVYVAGWNYEWGVNYDFIFAKYDANGNFKWSKTRNYTSGDQATQILYDPQGFIYVAGFVNGVYSTTGGSFCLMKYSTNGDSIWEFVDSHTYVGQVAEIAMDHAGNIVMAGHEGTSGGMSFMTTKIDPDGNQLWYKMYDNMGPNHTNRIFGMCIDASDNVYVTGTCDDTTNFYTDIVTIKYSSLGDSLWLKKLDGPTHYYDQGAAVRVDQNNNVYVGGYVSSQTPGQSDWVLAKYTSDGTLIWTKYYDSQAGVRSYDELRTMEIDGSGNICAIGKTSTSNSQASTRIGIVKFNPAGDTLWTRKWGQDGDKIPQDMVLDATDNIYLTGAYYDALGATGYNGVTLKYSASGAFLWEALFTDSTNLEQELNAITLDGEDNPIVTGRSHSPSTFDFATIKYQAGPTGLPAMGLESNPLQLGCYPNPFLRSATARYHLQKASPTRLTVTDMLGNQVLVLHEGHDAAGLHEIAVDMTALPAGIYHLQLVSNQGSRTTRIMHLQ